MRIATAAPPTWPPPIAHPGVLVSLPLRPVRLGQVVEVAGAAVSAARTGQGFASGSLGFGSTGQALSSTGSLIGTASAVAAIAPVLVGMAAIPVVGWIGAAVGALLMIAGGLFGGKPQLTHAQREAREVARVGGTVQGMIGEIQATSSLDALWDTLVRWQSGYVGGTSPVAVSVSLYVGVDRENALTLEMFAPRARQALNALEALVADGSIILPTGKTNYAEAVGADPARIGSAGFQVNVGVGKPNVYYPVFTKAGFFKQFQSNPGRLFIGTQAGVTPSMLDPINTAVRNTILNQLDRLGFGTAAAPASTVLDPAAVSTWVGQAYQKLLGRAPTSTERSTAVTALTAQQVTPQQFLSALMGTAEFVVAHGTAAAVTPSGAVLTGGAATTTGQPLSTYWWQQALLQPTGLLAPGPSAVPAVPSPVLMASIVPTGPSGAAWLLGVGAFGLLGVMLFAPPRGRRRR